MNVFRLETRDQSMIHSFTFISSPSCYSLSFLLFSKLEFLSQACACFWATSVVSEVSVLCWPSTLGLRFPWKAASVCSHLRRARWHLSDITLPQVSQGWRKSVLGCVISEPLAASKGISKNNDVNVIGWDRTGHVELLKPNTNVLIALQIYSVCTLGSQYEWLTYYVCRLNRVRIVFKGIVHPPPLLISLKTCMNIVLLWY